MEVRCTSTLHTATNCGELTAPHKVCKNCGYYKGVASNQKGSIIFDYQSVNGIAVLPLLFKWLGLRAEEDSSFSAFCMYITSL